jgi:signal transduction histidine kinase
VGVTTSFIRRHTSIPVGRRLFFGLLPALLAVLVTAGLAYYGEYGRVVPGLILAIAAVLSVASLVVTWINTRYLSARINRLTGSMPESEAERHGESDEFDRIERVVDHLGSALSASEAERARLNAAAEARLRDEATMLAAVAHDSIGQLDEVRLPLHILLETRFGDLNENQEELLRDARNAADAMGTALRRLAQVADADRGALAVQRELVQVNDVVRAVLPLARAAAERHGARVDVTLEPGLPRVRADRARLAEALTLFASEAADTTGTEKPMVVTTTRQPGAGVEITIGPNVVADAKVAATDSSPAAAPDAAAEAGRQNRPPGGVILARRLIAIQGGTADDTADAYVIRLAGPRES